MSTRNKLEKEKENLTLLERSTNKLDKDLNEISSNSYIEGIARNNFKLGLPNEITLEMPKDEDIRLLYRKIEKAEEEETTKKSVVSIIIENLNSWRKFFF